MKPDSTSQPVDSTKNAQAQTDWRQGASSTTEPSVFFGWESNHFTKQEQEYLDSLATDTYGQKYRRIGYYASLQYAHLDGAGLQELLAVETQPFDKRLKDCTNVLAQKQQYFADQLRVLDDQLAKTNENIQSCLAIEYPRLREELVLLEAEIKLIDANIVTLRRELATQKAHLSSGRFERLGQELTQIAGFAEEYREKVRQSLTHHTPTSMIAHRDWLIRWRTRLEADEATIGARLQNLASAGFSLDAKASHRYLYALFGLLATGIAGWLFSIYTSTDTFPIRPPESQTVFDGQSIVSVLVQSFLEYASLVGGWHFVLYGLGSLVAITALIMIYDSLYTKMLEKRQAVAGSSGEKTLLALQQNQIKIDSDFEQPDAFFKLNLRAGNWLEFWLKLAPALVILLPVVAVVATLTREKPELYKAYFYSFYNTLYGSWMSLALTGVFYIYLVRKLESPAGGEQGSSRWPGIGLVLLAFLAFLIALGVDYAVEAVHIQQVVLVGFGCMSTVAGVCIGYYLRVSSLLQSQALYQDDILTVNRALLYQESMGRIESLRGEGQALWQALGKYTSNATTITALSYAFEIPQYYQEVETHVAQQQDTVAAQPAPSLWQQLQAGYQRVAKWVSQPFRSEKNISEQAPLTESTSRTLRYTILNPPKRLKVSDHTLFPVLAEELKLKYEEYRTKQLRREQILNELNGPHANSATLLSRLYEQVEKLEIRKKPLIAEAASLHGLYEKQYRLLLAEKEEALLHLREGYFAQQWELKTDSGFSGGPPR
jgi:hypothetical protein